MHFEAFLAGRWTLFDPTRLPRVWVTPPIPHTTGRRRNDRLFPRSRSEPNEITLNLDLRHKEQPAAESPLGALVFRGWEWVGIAHWR